jgi:hypothetical protein
MSKRKRRTSYGLANIQKRIIGIEDLILKGTVLSIDPSCVSATSNPAYALYEGGELIEVNEIDCISPRLALETRLQLLGKFCREEFEEPDVLAIEHIVMGGRLNMQSTIRSTGAIIGNFETEHVIPIPPLVWQKIALKHLNLEGDSDYSKYKEYKLHYKSDKADAIWIGRAIIELAKEQYEN